MIAYLVCGCLTLVICLLLYNTIFFSNVNSYMQKNIISYVHSCIQTALCLPILISNVQLFFYPHEIVAYNPTPKVWVIAVTSHWVFIWYSIMEINFVDLQNIYIYHHVVNSFFILCSLVSGLSFFSLCGLSTEASTVLLHAVKLNGYRSPWLNYAFVATFFTLRIIVPSYLLVVSILYGMYTIAFGLACNLCLNTFWMAKIVDKFYAA